MKHNEKMQRNDVWGRLTEPKRWQAIVESLKPEDSVLDFGCGQGAYVSRLNRKRIRCIGADLYEYEGWQSIAESVGKPVGSLFQTVQSGQLPFVDSEFDMVCTFEVLEHCLDPLDVLRELKRICRREIILSVPDCRTDHRLRAHSLAFAHWTDVSHVNHFTPDSLRSLFEDAGLKVTGLDSAYKIDLNRCFWDHTKLPSFAKRFLTSTFDKLRLVDPYWSSILIKATV